MPRERNRILRVLKELKDWLGAQLVLGCFRLLRAFTPERAGDFGASLMRSIGPLLPENRTALSNLRHALPELPEAEHRRILAASWENLGRTYAEYVNLDRIWDFDPDRPSAGRVEVTGIEEFVRLRESGSPAIIFTCHLANWEVLAVAAAKHALPLSAVYRPPNNRYLGRRILALRSRSMGRLIPSGRLASLAMAAALERGEHLGLLVDQHFTRGVPVPFFGRPAMTNPILARLAARYECPIHGARVIRLPDLRYRVEFTPAIEPVRNQEGRIDVAGTMARVTSIVEGWVREHPEQWLWQHRRWR